MDGKYYFYITLIISVIVQIITMIIELGSLFINVPSEFSLIKQLLVLEVLVQIIEGLFYIWLLYNFTKVVNITPNRYIDWVITTPTMLIQMILYLIYLKSKKENSTKELEFFSLINENSKVIIPVVLLNWLMLLFGYLGESKIIPVLLGVFLGFIPFLIYYYMIYINYVSENNIGKSIFWYFFFFWSLYGLVAVLPYYIKNAFYNILDLFSKNFFGIFLSYIILTKNY
jgi:bacteriorhodopsin